MRTDGDRGPHIVTVIVRNSQKPQQASKELLENSKTPRTKKRGFLELNKHSSFHDDQTVIMQ